MMVTSKILSLILSGMVPDVSAAVELFPRDIAAAELMVTEVLGDAAELKKAILSIPSKERTYENTVRAYDRLDQLLGVVGNSFGSLLTVFKYVVSADAQNRSVPYDRFRIESIKLSTDRAFFMAFKEYEQNNMLSEILTDEQKYYFTKTMRSFELLGYGLSEAAFQEVLELTQEEERLSSDFCNAISNDNSFIAVPESALTGVDAQFIASQERDGEGNIKLYTKFPIFLAVQEYCSNPEVRSAFFDAMHRRAYPQNTVTLERLIAVRSARAQLLGFASYNDFRLNNLLMKDAKTAYTFLESLEEPARILFSHDVMSAKKTIPSNVRLDQNGSILNADFRYVLATHKKAYYALDDRLIAEYFPVKKTIAGMLAIYEKFMNVELEYVEHVPGVWHDSVQGITVYTHGRTKVLGYILLDLYPRPYKYSHACCCDSFARTTNRPDLPAVSVVIANFPRPQGDAPALLSYGDVKTFFHEFGHAMHNTLSYTDHYGTRAYAVPIDFLEVPSVMLEAWMRDRDILKMVSAHYITGESLPDVLIDQLLTANNYGIGWYELRQLFFTRLSLDCFAPGADKDVQKLFLELLEKYSPGIAINQNDRYYAAFDHLTFYGPTYYCYALARAYAGDMFAVIKQHGLLNPEIGKRFVDCVLAPGASKDADQLLADFLGKPATSDAYIAWLKSLLPTAEA